MSVELKEKQYGSIPVSEMRDGQIAVIVKWGNIISVIDLIVQKHKKGLVSIGLETSCGWTNVSETNEENRVKILKNGTELIIKDNE